MSYMCAGAMINDDWRQQVCQEYAKAGTTSVRSPQAAGRRLKPRSAPMRSVRTLAPHRWPAKGLRYDCRAGMRTEYVLPRILVHIFSINGSWREPKDDRNCEFAEHLWHRWTWQSDLSSSGAVSANNRFVPEHLPVPARYRPWTARS